MKTAAVIGGGPAGLMAAQVLADQGLKVTVYDAMPSVGRKFLMAGKSGLNLTKQEPAAQFTQAFGALPPALSAALDDFGPDAIMDWAQGLGQSLFTGSTGRVFPEVMKASPLLRAWLARLQTSGVTLRTRMRWTGWDNAALTFATPNGAERVQADVTILALGGASWRKLGSDGAWADLLPCAPFAPANMGFMVDWSAQMAAHFGKPIKSVALQAGDLTSRGEFVISARGIEGGGIYAVSRAMREGAALHIDLRPDWPRAKVAAALQKPRGKQTMANHLRRVLRLEPAQIALLFEFGRPLPADLTDLVKALPVTHKGPRPMDEAISTAGGVRFDAMHGFALRARPNTFCAGEMLDWEAPTGGYLLTACFATGRAAALQAARFSRGAL